MYLKKMTGTSSAAPSTALVAAIARTELARGVLPASARCWCGKRQFHRKGVRPRSRAKKESYMHTLRVLVLHTLWSFLSRLPTTHPCGHTATAHAAELGRCAGCAHARAGSIDFGRNFPEPSADTESSKQTAPSLATPAHGAAVCGVWKGQLVRECGRVRTSFCSHLIPSIVCCFAAHSGGQIVERTRALRQMW